MSDPLISVLIAAYRAEKTLERAINSIARESYSNWEAIIVDDRSDDGTYELARRIADNDSRVKVIKLKENRGPSGARNAAINASSGEWVTVLDADDEFKEGRLERFVRFIRENDYDIIFDNMAPLSSVDENAEPFWPGWKSLDKEISFLEMIKGCAGAFSSNYGLLKPFIKKDIMYRLNVFYDETLRRGEDVNLYLRLILKGARAGRLREIGYLYDVPDIHNHNGCRASLLNLKDSYIGTRKVRDEFGEILDLKHKFWFSVRLARSYVSPDWDVFLEEKNSCNWLGVIKLILSSKCVAYKLLVGFIPVKVYRLYKRILTRKP